MDAVGNVGNLTKIIFLGQMTYVYKDVISKEVEEDTKKKDKQ